MIRGSPTTTRTTVVVDLTDEMPEERELSRATRRFLAALDAVDPQLTAIRMHQQQNLEWRLRRPTILRKPVMRDLGPIAQTRIVMIQESSGSTPLEVTRWVGNYILAKTN